ncbi:uncharacterized protein LOC123398288 [Hordeum vulgare subsp. vulgare]|uniref:uncharacterized protein LOC123398288 n=1 Tax=Hordeum vulgare subsp. vulgare TaxID=112509 RepID=UPI001D1A5134|nr:uncharacterized protein LOC123398288 [Hordeum vulgare subsp. vulgare]
MSYSINNRKWINANKKCLAFVKNTIDTTIVGSIAECPTAKEMLNKIKSQFTGSSKTYATQLIKQLVTESYTGGGHGIREDILRMSNTAAKLKPMDADLEIKPALLVHLVMASLPKEFETFVVNYNMQPETWDIEKVIAMCSQEEERIKDSHGGSLNYVKEKKGFPTQQRFSLKATWQRLWQSSRSLSPKAYPSRQGHLYVLQGEMALQEELCCLAKGLHGKERGSVRRGPCAENKEVLKSQMVSKQKLKL